MDEFEKNYNRILKFLTYRPRSEKEVRDKLKSKNINQEIIERIIKKLKNNNFINDAEFTKWWIEQRTTATPKSLKLIRMELKQKGISDNLLLKFKNVNFETQRDLKVAKRICLQKFIKYKNLSNQEKYLKLSRYLLSKGFNWEIIKQSIDEILKKEL